MKGSSRGDTRLRTVVRGMKNMTKSTIDCPPNPVLAAAYLDHLVIAIRVNDQTRGIFRAFLDPWYAYTFGGPFLGSSGRPVWPNKPCSVGSKDLLLAADWMSTAAKLAIETKTKISLMLDHSIPVRVLSERMRQLKLDTPARVDEFLRLWYRRGVLTKEEDDRLSLPRLPGSSGLRRRMPEGWDWAPGSEFDRYQCASIPGSPIYRSDRPVGPASQACVR
jgi:hypothetical protein